MFKLVPFVILSVTFLVRTFPGGEPVNARALNPQQDAEPSNQDRARFETWLKSAGLSNQFEIVRIGLGPHPDPELALDSPIHHLELRFLPTSSNASTEVARFRQYLEKYRAEHSAAFPVKVFYEFVHAFSLDRKQACVDFDVTEIVYSAYISRQDSSIVLRTEENKSPSRFSVLIPALAPQGQFRIQGGKQPVPNSKYVGDAVQKILTTYLLEAYRSKAGPAPEIIPERDDGYLGLSVQGGKGLVTDRYWEWISIDVEFYKEGEASEASESKWRFFCNVNVKYASSPRERSPTDADSDYALQVANFRKKVNDQLQGKLDKDIHD